jgi:hypothetical protein
MCHQLKKSWLQPFGNRKVLFLWNSCIGWQQWILTTILKRKEVCMLAFIEFVPQEKCLKCCSSMTVLGHTQVCAPQRP